MDFFEAVYLLSNRDASQSLSKKKNIWGELLLFTTRTSSQRHSVKPCSHSAGRTGCSYGGTACSAALVIKTWSAHSQAQTLSEQLSHSAFLRKYVIALELKPNIEIQGWFHHFFFPSQFQIVHGFRLRLLTTRQNPELQQHKDPPVTHKLPFKNCWMCSRRDKKKQH